jgi:hypothetical protein
MFQAGNDYFTTEDISWANCIGICRDGTGHKTHFLVEVRKIAPHANFIHCITHKEGLESRDLEPKLQFVLQGAVKVVNSLKVHQVNTRLFAILCEEI